MKTLKKRNSAKTKAENELLKQKNFSEKLIKTAQVIILTLDRKGRIINYNPYLEKLSGRSFKSMKGRDWFTNFLPKEERKEIRKIFHKAIRGISTRGNVNVIVTKSGKKVHIEWFDSVLKNEDGDTIGLLSIGQDVTERYKIQESVLNEQRQLFSIFESMDEVVYVADPDTYELLYMNKVTQKHWGKNIGKKCYSVLQNRNKPCPFCTNDKILGRNTGKTVIWEFRNEINKRWYRCIDRAIKWPNGKMVRCELAIDITDIKKYNLKLKKSEQRFRQIAESAEEWIWEVDDKAVYTYSSPIVEKLLGYKPEEIIGKKHSFDLFAPEDRKRLKDKTYELFAKKKPLIRFINRNLHKDGHVVWLSTNGFPIIDKSGKLLGYRGADVDITDVKNAQLKLKESEEEYRMITENTTDLIAVTSFDISAKFIYLSPSYKLYFGYNTEALIGKSAFKLIHPEDTKKLIPLLKSYMQKKIKGLFTKNAKVPVTELIEYRIKDSSGKWHILQSTANPVKDRLIFVSKDITERRKVEDKLRHNERFLQTTFDSIQDGISVLSKDLTIMRVNKWIEKLYGKQENLLGRKCYEAYQGRKSICEWCPSRKVLKDKKMCRAVVPMQKNGKRKGWIELSAYPLLGENGKLSGVIEYAKDISERIRSDEELREAYARLKDTQAQLIQAEKMEAVGRMASGVAHEVKNPLGIVLQGINYFEEALPDEDKNKRTMLEMMKNNLNRADNIVRTLLDFSKSEKLETANEDINSILLSSLSLTQHRIKQSNIKLIKELEQSLPKIQADKGKVEQVFMNLFLNAVDAMPEGGRLYIRSYISHLDKTGERIGRRRTDFYMPGERVVVVEIEDTGTGIDKKDISRIFDPFYTSKKQNEGTGLGLSISKSIITMHKGLIEVDSIRKKGTKFTLAFKIAKR